MAKLEVTPTLEEFGYSFIPTNWLDPSLENLFYWEVKASISLGPLAARTLWMMRAGMTFEAAGYAATQNSYFMYRVFSKGRTIATVATAPPLLIGATALAAHHYTMTSPPPTSALRSEPGQTSWWRAVAQSIGAGGFGTGSWNP